jgi:hypothetical protein
MSLLQILFIKLLMKFFSMWIENCQNSLFFIQKTKDEVYFVQ